MRKKPNEIMSNSFGRIACFSIGIIAFITITLCLVYGIFLLVDPLAVTTMEQLVMAHIDGIVLVSVAGVAIGCALICSCWICCKLIAMEGEKQRFVNIVNSA